MGSGSAPQDALRRWTDGTRVLVPGTVDPSRELNSRADHRLQASTAREPELDPSTAPQHSDTASGSLWDPDSGWWWQKVGREGFEAFSFQKKLE